MNVHINGYALALFSIAKDNQKINYYKKQSTLLLELIKKNVEYKKIMDSKQISFTKKESLIEESFGKILNKEFKHFLLILIKRHKFKSIDKILKKLIKFINEENNISEGIIYTYDKLSLVNMNQIQEKVSKLLNKKVFLVNKIDKNVILGFKVQVGDEIIEDTLSSRIEKLKNKLLEKRKDEH